MSEGVSVPSFYQWRKKLDTQRPKVAARGGQQFAAVRVIAAANVGVQLPGGTRLEIPMSDTRSLQLALRTIIRADAQRSGEETC